MKTEIINQISLKENQELAQVLPLDNNTFVVLLYQDNKPLIKIYGNKERTIKLPKPLYLGWNNFKFTITSGHWYINLFQYKKGFGIATTYGKVWLWKDLHSLAQRARIKFPYYSKGVYLKDFLKELKYQESDDSFIVGFRDEVSTWGSKYWAKINAKDQRLFGLKFPLLKWKAGELNLLPEKQYPRSKMEMYKHFWLTIKAMGSYGNSLFFHTNGGANTRTKSGPDYDFSIISEFNQNGEFIRNHDIEEGWVFFGPDTKRFVLITRNKKKALVYKIAPFGLEHEISLTPKQNIGDSKPKYILAQIMDDQLYVYSRNFLNVCKLVP